MNDSMAFVRPQWLLPKQQGMQCRSHSQTLTMLLIYNIVATLVAYLLAMPSFFVPFQYVQTALLHFFQRRWRAIRHKQQREESSEAAAFSSRFQSASSIILSTLGSLVISICAPILTAVVLSQGRDSGVSTGILIQQWATRPRASWLVFFTNGAVGWVHRNILFARALRTGAVQWTTLGSPQADAEDKSAPNEAVDGESIPALAPRPKVFLDRIELLFGRNKDLPEMAHLRPSAPGFQARVQVLRGMQAHNFYATMMSTIINESVLSLIGLKFLIDQSLTGDEYFQSLSKRQAGGASLDNPDTKSFKTPPSPLHTAAGAFLVAVCIHLVLFGITMFCFAVYCIRLAGKRMVGDSTKSKTATWDLAILVRLFTLLMFTAIAMYATSWKFWKELLNVVPVDMYCIESSWKIDLVYVMLPVCLGLWRMAWSAIGGRCSG
ncbi:hypothetical protein MMC24_000525 [Lignoscripta atroalba]|nr:hypothetical protein [Lignoscripta atroalba]